MAIQYIRCPNCREDYDEIDQEYQICSICGFVAPEVTDVDNNYDYEIDDDLYD